MQESNVHSPLSISIVECLSCPGKLQRIHFKGQLSFNWDPFYFSDEIAMMKLSLSLVWVLATTINSLGQHPILHNGDERPNIVVILTDDQDLHMDSVDYMPLLKKHVIDHGTFYKHHYCSTAICCPSRVTLWTGRNAHNTNVTDVFPPYGRSPS
jgi:hypothetical protein